VEGADQLAVADRVDLSEPAGDRPVDDPSMLRGEAAGLALDQAGLPLADPAGPQESQGVGQLVAQRPRQPHLALPTVWRDPSGEGDLVTDAAPLPLGQLATSGGRCALGSGRSRR